MPLSSLQGGIYGVSRKAASAAALPRLIEKLRLVSVSGCIEEQNYRLLHISNCFTLHIHLHVWLIDGLNGRTSEGLSLHPVQLDAADITAVSQAIHRRVLCVFQRRGLLSGEAAQVMHQWVTAAGSRSTVRASGNDRAGRERRFCYCARPLFAAEPPFWEPGVQRLRYALPRPGTRD